MGLSTIDSLSSGPLSDDFNVSHPGPSALVSRMAYVWEKYASQKLSSVARDLLLTSWRTKSDLHGEGYQSSSLNVFRSAISLAHNKMDSVEVGKHPTIACLLKEAYHVRPPLPRYTSTWDVDKVFKILKGLGPTETLNLKLLTYKLIMLLVLTRTSWSADLFSFDIARRCFNPEK